jgi:hypothetical protein
MGSALAHQLVQTLSRISSPDDLFESLIALEGLLLDGSVVDEEAPCLDSSAVLGLFVRKVLIRFHTGLFESLSNLFTLVQSYVSAYLNPEILDPCCDTSVQAELINFIPHHAGLIETAPPSLQVQSIAFFFMMKLIDQSSSTAFLQKFDS